MRCDKIAEKVFGGETIEFRGGIKRIRGRKFADIGRTNPAGDKRRPIYLRGLRAAVQRRQKIAPDALPALRELHKRLAARKDNAAGCDAASLVHDDIIDTSKKRRGVETANSKYGAQIAVLIGDYLFAKAFQLVAENDYGAEVSTILSKLVKNLCVGEIMQDRSLYEVPTLAEYYTRINLKTAIFLSSCCRLGAIVAEMDSREVENLTSYGTNLGLAFQIIDDLLDFFGDEKVTGKPHGGDLKSGVITLPVIRALEVSNESARLKQIVTNGADVDAAIKIIQATDAVDYCRTRAEAHIESARVNLPLTLKTSVALALEQVADFIVDRTR